jgi:hypothetical protein
MEEVRALTARPAVISTSTRESRSHRNFTRKMLGLSAVSRRQIGYKLTSYWADTEGIKNALPVARRAVPQ